MESAFAYILCPRSTSPRSDGVTREYPVNVIRLNPITVDLNRPKTQRYNPYPPPSVAWPTRPSTKNTPADNSAARRVKRRVFDYYCPIERRAGRRCWTQTETVDVVQRRGEDSIAEYVTRGKTSRHQIP